MSQYYMPVEGQRPLWKEIGLKDFADYSDCVTYCNQSECSDDQLEGQWFFVDEEPLPNGFVVIYYGTFGNDNSPGADSYTSAQVFDPNDPNDLLEFMEEKARWEGLPEYVEQENNFDVFRNGHEPWSKEDE